MTDHNDTKGILGRGFIGTLDWASGCNGKGFQDTCIECQDKRLQGVCDEKDEVIKQLFGALSLMVLNEVNYQRINSRIYLMDVPASNYEEAVGTRNKFKSYVEGLTNE